MRRILISLLALGASAAHADDFDTKAKGLQKTAIIVDGHLDAPMALEEKWADVGERGATPHFDLPRAKEGGLTAPFFSIFVSPMYAEKGAAKEALELIDITKRVVADHAADMMMAYTRKLGRLPGRVRFQVNVSNLLNERDIIPVRLSTSATMPDGFEVPGGRGLAFSRHDLVTPREIRFTTT